MSMIGSVDRCSPTELSGWAWDPQHPETRVSVQAIDSSGQVIAQFLAARFRSDLLSANIGDGYHAFQIQPFGYSARLLETNITFIVVETGDTLSIAHDAYEEPNYQPDQKTLELGSKGLSPSQPPMGPINKVYPALDAVYNIIEGQYPSVALALNNTTTRLRPFIPVQLDVIFIIGLRDGESKRYRVYNVAAALTRAGFLCGIYYQDEVEEILARAPKFRTCVIFRAPLYVEIQTLIAYCKSIGARTLWDVDDYVFDTRVLPQIDGLKYLSIEDRIKNAEGMRLYQECLLAVDHATTSTEYLAECIRKLGQLTTVIPNTLDSEQISLQEAFGTRSVRREDIVTLGFFSGTKTHDRDFSELHDALVSIMRKYVNTRLIIVGYFDLSLYPEFFAFGDRVEKIEFVPYLKMLDLLRYIDINLVPLEMIPYCHGKSELKFFEAGLVGCVTVASATDTYKRAIQSGVTGFVCGDREAWFGALDLLCTSKGMRDEMGAAARNVALSVYTADRYVERITAAYGLPSVGRRLDQINVPVFVQQTSSRGAMVLPSLLLGGGGHRKALLFASAIAAADISMELIFQNSAYTCDQLRDIINGAYYPFANPIRIYNGSFSGYSWLIATSWSTAYSIIESGFPPDRVIYLVQDFEPFFYAIGSDFIRAEATYLAGFHVVTLGNWCADYLQSRYNVRAIALPFPLEREVYFPADISREKRILFFAKPEMSRRCFEIGSDALSVFHRLCPDIEIVLFGSSETKALSLNYPCRDLGIISNLRDLSFLYSSALMGIAFSTTNPSLVGYEMLACGCPVVDLDRPDTLQNYNAGEFGVIKVRPFPFLFANTIANVIRTPKILRKHHDAAAAVVSTMPSDQEISTMVVELVRTLLINNRKVTEIPYADSVSVNEMPNSMRRSKRSNVNHEGRVDDETRS